MQGTEGLLELAGPGSHLWLPVLALHMAAGCWPWTATVPSLVANDFQ